MSKDSFNADLRSVMLRLGQAPNADAPEGRPAQALPAQPVQQSRPAAEQRSHPPATHDAVT